jgi:hypothetical protein
MLSLLLVGSAHPTRLQQVDSEEVTAARDTITMIVNVGRAVRASITQRG